MQARQIAKPAPPDAAKKVSEPPESGWDDASEDPATSLPSRALVPAIVDARDAPGSAEAEVPPAITAAGPAEAEVPPAITAASASATPTPEARPMAPAPAASLDGAAPQGLTPELERQILGVLRAALEEMLAPLVGKQKELEARLEALHKAEQRPTVAAPAIPAAPGAPARSALSSFDVPPTPRLPAASARPPAIVSTSYGLVSLPPPGSTRPSSIEIEVASLGPIEMPDFGSRRRLVGRLVIALLFAVVLAAIMATILSYM